MNPKAEEPFVKIMAYRHCVVVCTSVDMADKMRSLVEGKSRDEIFENPHVYGQTLHYVPDQMPRESENQHECLWKEEISTLKGILGFDNSLAFDQNGHTSTKVVCTAKEGDKIIGIAGASETTVDHLYEIGMDVDKKYRNRGLATSLVNELTRELLEKDMVPFYSASVTNIGSQMVANRCGYIPVWVDTYGTKV